MSDAGPRFVWVDGRVRPAGETHLSVFDRGFQLGDGVFETLRARGGHVTELAEHTARLRRSAEGLAIELPADVADLVARGIAELLAAEGLDGPDADASVRITVSRGPWTSRGLLPPSSVHLIPTIVIQAWPVAPAPADHLERGLSLVASAVRQGPVQPHRHPQDHVPRRLRLRAARGAPGRGRGRGVPDDVRPPVRGHDREHLPGPDGARRRGGAGDAGTRLRHPAGHDPLVAAALGRRRRPAAGRGLAHPRRAGRGLGGVHVVVGRGGAPGHPVQRPPHRQRRARPVDAARARRPRGGVRRAPEPGLGRVLSPSAGVLGEISATRSPSRTPPRAPRVASLASRVASRSSPSARPRAGTSEAAPPRTPSRLRRGSPPRPRRPAPARARTSRPPCGRRAGARTPPRPPGSIRPSARSASTRPTFRALHTEPGRRGVIRMHEPPSAGIRTLSIQPTHRTSSTISGQVTVGRPAALGRMPTHSSVAVGVVLRKPVAQLARANRTRRRRAARGGPCRKPTGRATA